MLGHNPANYHVEYLDISQHWDAASQGYGGGDALLTFLTQGWHMDHRVEMEYKWFGGNRRVRIYHCTLRHEHQVMVLPVLHNPYVNRLLRQAHFTIEPRQTQPLQAEKVRA